jgi:hypothetical protein
MGLLKYLMSYLIYRKKNSMKHDDFAIFILTHGRADNVVTYKTLQKTNYTGKVYFIVDSGDKQIDKYIENFGAENVIIFDKAEIVKEFDVMDNFDNNKTIVYARNACFKIARDLGIKYFMELDDDYDSISYRYNHDLKFIHKKMYLFDEVLDCFLDFYKSTNIKSVAMAQGGDFIGGDNGFAFSMTRVRKCMNTFICSTEREFKFLGKFNEDVNVYAGMASRGDIFLTIPFVMINQKQTQSNKGGMTEDYLDAGTYVKSFYTVMLSPSSVKIALMGDTHKRLHHAVTGENTYPMIIPEKYKYERRFK